MATHREKNELSDYVWNPITGSDEVLKNGSKATLSFTGDVRWNLGKGVHEEIDGMLVLNDVFKNEFGKAVSMPFGTIPTLYRYRFKDINKIVHSSIILIGTRGDIFQTWCKNPVLEEIFKEIELVKRHNYLFLTGNPERYIELFDKNIIKQMENCWFGAVVHRSSQLPRWPEIKNFLYIVPEERIELKQYLQEQKIDWIVLDSIDNISEKQWFDEIIQQADARNTPVFMKDRLKKFYPKLRKERPRMMKSCLKKECMCCKKQSDTKGMIRIFVEQKNIIKKQLLGFLCEECFEKQYQTWNRVEKVKELKEKGNEKN